MNWRQEIYSNCVTKLKDLQTDGKLNYIDLDKGQLENSSKTNPVSKPAALINIQSSGDITHLTRNFIESDNTIISIKLAFDNRHLSFSDSEAYQDSINMLEIIDNVINKLVFLNGDTFTDFHYVSDEKQDNEFNGIQTHIITFSTSLTDELNPN